MVEILHRQGINEGSAPLASIEKINQEVEASRTQYKKVLEQIEKDEREAQGDQRPRGGQGKRKPDPRVGRARSDFLDAGRPAAGSGARAVMESPASRAQIAHTPMRGSSQVAVVLALLVPAGCSLLREGSGGYAAGSGTAGVDGQDGSAGGGGGTAMHCSALPPFGCACGPEEPTQVGACNTTSVVKMPGQQGVCCDNAFNCICVAYECVRGAGSGCSCQLAQPSMAGTRVENCSAVTASPTIKCCRGYGTCVCSSMDCVAGLETQVSGCSVQDLLACAVGEVSVGSCEGTGSGGEQRRSGRRRRQRGRGRRGRRQRRSRRKRRRGW